MTSPHRFSRLELLYGQDALADLAEKSVAVFGLGGVGSYAVEGLVRGGVGRLTLVDFDSVDITNLNRQIHAVEATVNRPKSVVMEERCLAINPDAVIDARETIYTSDSADELLAQPYDYVLDCIDQITAKLNLIEECMKRGIPLISSMGAANKLDPTQVKVADLSHTHKCRMARIIRRELRRRGIKGGFQVVYSTEDFRPLVDGRQKDPGSADEIAYQSRRAPLGSSSVIPPIFGLTMAGEVLQSLLERTEG